MPKPSRFKLPPLVVVDDKTLGQRLAAFRKAKGLTQIQFAKQVGVIQSVISSWELDTTRPSAEMAARLAQALGVSTDELLGLKPAKPAPRPPITDRRILKRLQMVEALPRRDQENILRTIDAIAGSRRSKAHA